MKGLKTLSEKSKKIVTRDRASWVKLFYSPSEDKVYDTDGEGRFFLTNLINENSPKDIEEAVRKMMAL